jgi:hypothetical protein
MNRLETWTIVTLLGAALAAFDLITGWTANGSPEAIAAGLGLIVAALILFGAMVISGRRDRRLMLGVAPDARTVLDKAARAIRWSGAFAAGFAVLLFTNCSSAISSGPNVHVPSATSDVSGFAPLSLAVLAPLVFALLLPPVFATTAQRLARTRPQAARRMANLAVWGSALAAGAVVATIPIGFFFGISACDLGTSAGACSAGASSFMNFFSLGSLALFLPYTALVSWALERMEYDRANTSPVPGK